VRAEEWAATALAVVAVCIWAEAASKVVDSTVVVVDSAAVASVSEQGLVTGLAIGGLGYGYRYGYPAYAYNGYYGGDCWVQRRVVYRLFAVSTLETN
jgi:hypothetical protein